MRTQSTRIAAFLARTPPFSSAGPAEISELAASGSLKAYRAGEVVFEEGDPSAASWLVMEGRVRILSFAGPARTIQVESIAPGGIFGLYCRLGSKLPYLCTAVAEEDSLLVRLLDRSIESMMKRSPAATRCLLDCCATRLRALRSLARSGRETVYARVISMLLSLRARHGDEILCTRHDLSTWVGSAQETVFRVLARLRAQGVLSTERGRIRILDAERLQKLARAPE